MHSPEPDRHRDAAITGAPVGPHTSRQPVGGRCLTDLMSTDPPVAKVEVRLRLRPRDDLPAGERLWATPLDAHDGGGTYELANCASHAWLAQGDLVRAEIDGDGDLQIVDVLEAGDGVVTGVAFTDEAAACAAGDAWLERGARGSEGGMGILKTLWAPEVGWTEITRAVAPYVASGELTWLGGAAPDDRGRDCHPDVDFELDRTQYLPDIETSYWAADDPFWREQGMDDPEFLAYVQTVAGMDPDIARALEQGDHAPLLELLRWLDQFH
jgi:hypothetical protein